MKDELKLQFICTQCGKEFLRSKRNAHKSLKNNCKPFCSQQCSYIYHNKHIKSNCGTCGKEIFTNRKDFNRSKSGKTFCSMSCSAIYNNAHKTTGYKRSKLELYIEQQLAILYPNLTILYNDKTTINSELDIYIPSLKLAFELNGIFHYEPIYGQEKLQSTKNNDERKFQACIEHNIELCLIDTSKQIYFKPSTSQKFLNIITQIINQKLSGM